MHDARSISKTVVALLYAIALDEGRVPAIDSPAIDALPDYAALVTPELRRVTIRHMLTMTSGFAWDEFTYPYQDARNSETLMDSTPDPVRYVFAQPFAHEPGTQWTYSGGDVAVVARILERGVITVSVGALSETERGAALVCACAETGASRMAKAQASVSEILNTITSH